MKEMYGLEKELGLRDAGAYAGGFSFYIDNVAFSLAMILGKIHVKLAQWVCSRLLFHAVKNRLGEKPKVEMILKAKGVKDGTEKIVEIILSSDDGFELTAIAVVALLNQYFGKLTIKPGVHIMGQMVEEKTLFQDIEKMGASLQLKSL